MASTCYVIFIIVESSFQTFWALSVSVLYPTEFRHCHTRNGSPRCNPARGGSAGAVGIVPCTDVNVMVLRVLQRSICGLLRNAFKKVYVCLQVNSVCAEGHRFCVASLRLLTQEKCFVSPQDGTPYGLKVKKRHWYCMGCWGNLHTQSYLLVFSRAGCPKA